MDDIRDMRDPNALGSFILDDTSSMTAAEAMDKLVPLPTIHIPSYSRSESTVTETVRKYREELEARAADGDKYAISMLTTGQPGDSDE